MTLILTAIINIQMKTNLSEKAKVTDFGEFGNASIISLQYKPKSQKAFCLHDLVC